MSFQSDIFGQEVQNELEQMIDLDLYNGLLANEDETLMMDDLAELKYLPVNKQNQHTSSGILSNEEYNGPCNFDVTIVPNGSKNSWVYSSLLNKVYMDMKSPFPVNFKVTNRPNVPLFIRATPVFSLPQHSQEPIYRCPNHESMDGPSQQMSPMRPHVIRCHNQDTEYIGDKEKKERLSLVIPFSFPQPGTDSVREVFEFVCKNSCPSPGMSRRPFEVIFTLENEECAILGRKTLNVRICSCPKRDKEKDESDTAGKPPPGKKRKIVEKPGKKVLAVLNKTSDTQEFTLTIPVVGKHNADQILKYVQDLMSGEILRHENGPDAAPYRRVLNQINAMIKQPSE